MILLSCGKRLKSMFEEKYLLVAVVFLVLFIADISVIGQSSVTPNLGVPDGEKQAELLRDQWNKESIHKAIEIYRNISVASKTNGNFENASGYLQEAARLLLILGENRSALDVLNESLEIAKSKNLVKEVSKTNSLLSLTFQKIGRTRESKDCLEIALKLAKISDDRFSLALANFTGGEYYYLETEYERSLEYYTTSVSIWKELGKARHQAETLVSISYIFMAFGRSFEGLKYAKQAENIFTDLNNARGLALSRIAIGHLSSAVNQKQIALDYYTKAKKNFPPELDLLEYGALLNGFGSIYENYQQYDLSLSYRLEALDVFEKDNYLAGQLSTMHSIIGLSYRLGQDSQAEKFINEAQRLSTELNDNYYISLVYREIADNYASKKLFDKARFYYLKSLSKTNNIGYRTNFVLINIKLGTIYFENSQFDLARRHFELSLQTSLELRNSFTQAECLYFLSKIEKQAGNDQASVELARQSIEITESLYLDVLNSKLKRSYFSNVFDRYELYIYLLMQKHQESADGNFAIRALESSERSRSRSLFETLRLSEANFTKDADPELVNKEKELRNLLSLKADKLTQLLSAKGEKSEIELVEVAIRNLQNELENVKAELKQKSPIYSTLKDPAPFDVAEFQENLLDDRTVLLEYSLGEKESYLWLVDKNSVSAFVLPKRELIETSVEKVLSTFEKKQIEADEDIDSYQKRMAEIESVFEQETKRLSTDLLGQVAERIKDKRLIVVPDGKLQYLPFSALPSPDTDEYLISTHEIIYEPSASTLSLLSKLQSSTNKATKDLLIFADPVFSGDDARLTNKAETDSTQPQVLGLNLRDFRLVSADGNIPRLLASRVEADSIAGIIGKSNTTMALGYDANREKVLSSDISNYKILHFATHGLIDVERPEVSSIVLSQFDESGNKREGFLRLQDIYALNLSSDLVVLSACQSGVGKEVKGEGLMSLNNAFLQAGAKTVLSSAWKVDDEATAELMKEFYANLYNKGVTPSEALRQAQLSLSKSTRFKSPFYWAAFTVQGGFHQPIDFTANYFNYLIIAAGAILIFVFWAMVRGSKNHRIKKK